MQLKPGQRVWSHAEFEFGTVIERHPVERDWYRVRLDKPNTDGQTVVANHAEELEPVEEKHSA